MQIELIKKIILILMICLTKIGFSQQMPSDDEKIPYLCTLGKNADKTYGDDDKVQIIFFSIPENSKESFYIRIFDPVISSKNDEIRGGENTKMRFSIYGGKGAHSDPDAKKCDPVGNYKSGILLGSHTFSNEIKYQDNWYTFGPFNATEGEAQPNVGGNILKLIVEGIDGDDGNLYKLFLSSKGDNNINVEGGNSFCYEYTFRLIQKQAAVSHIYPFVPVGVISVLVNVFDYDNEGIIRAVTVAKKSDIKESNSEGTWTQLKFLISKEEINTSIDLQFINKKNVKNNNVTVYITNQFGELLPFYSTPIGGVPKYKYKIGVKQKE